jgi:prolipoprotein diacylglyceryl transferase
VTLAAIPSPTTAVWELGPVPLRAYALFIVAGIVLACVVTEYRLRQRGAPKYAVIDLAVWAVPFGIVGARIYHVISSPQAYFGEGGDPLRALQIWHGGLGIWGAIAGGALGVWLACRFQLKLPFLVVADAAAVGLPLAQAVGRLGNWFNNELYGSQTTLPWGLQVHDMVNGRAVVIAGEPVTHPVLYHPTFLYEMLWNIGVALLVLYVGNRLRLGKGRQFALYVAAYTAGRFWIEMLRIDGEAEGTTVILLGARINVWVSLLVFAAAVAYLVRVRGEQEYLLPLDADADADRAGYRIVTETEYREALAAAATSDQADGDQADADQADGDQADGDQADSDQADSDRAGADAAPRNDR